MNQKWCIYTRSLREPFKRLSVNMPWPKRNFTKEQLEDLYINKKLNGPEICKMLQCDHRVLYRYLRKFGIPIRTVSASKTKHKLSKEYLEDLYVKHKLTIKSISIITGASEGTICIMLKTYGIKTQRKGCLYPQPKGILSPNYKEPALRKSTIINQLRRCFKYKEWRMQIYERDNYTCQICGDARGGNLNADHIIPFSYIVEVECKNNFEIGLNSPILWDISNGRTLCETCHKNTDTWGTKALFWSKDQNKTDTK